MTVILQISDPHFGTEREPVVQALRACAAELEPELLIVSGDITQRAHRQQFARAADFVRTLAIPNVLSIPGNHDVPLYNLAARALSPYAAYERYFGTELEPRFASADCLVLTVNATRWYRHVDGEVSSAQRERVAGELQRATPEQLRIVVLHQPLAVPRSSEQQNIAHGAAPAIAAWAEAGADLLLSGHIHLPFVLPLHEDLSLRRPLWAVGAGTAVSSRVRHDAPNSVNVVRTSSEAGARSCIVEQWMFDASAASFRRSAQLRIVA
jgi:3',5'-cyclic AMP phosphodiesterase CpdA